MKNDLKTAIDYKIKVYVYDDFPKTDDEFNIIFSFDNIDIEMINFIKTCLEQDKYIALYKC